MKSNPISIFSENLKKLPLEIQEIITEEKFSKSEKNGISLLTDNDLAVYSPGVSTGGLAEIAMVLLSGKRKVISTTLDLEGIKEVEKYIYESGLNSQITIKAEDVSEPLGYQNNTFDFVYVRLLLHYLTKQKLVSSLKELNRILKPKKKMFVVVRSTDDPDTKIPGTTFDPETNLTTYSWRDETGTLHPDKRVSRYFHSRKSITDHLTKADFNILSVNQYDEQLYLDFSRKKISPIVGNIIEVVAEKQ